MRKDIELFIEQMSKCWGADTSYFNDDRNPRCAGQCACSALCIQDKFGGEIKRIIIGNTRHYFNFIDGVIIDSTASQYLIERGIDYSNATNPPDDFPHQETIEKYKLLKRKMESK
ncbi:MAG: hypothetical protein LBF37_04135 [Rickettsiales bacterium]|jgi:hypothetical protein|nr:hypothetical protein [Rickettsiales bacterium]